MSRVKRNKHYLFLAIFLFCWLPILFVSTVLVGLVYVTVHQSYRQGANDPQIQLARDSAMALQTATQLPYVSSAPQIDVATSLSPFRIIYNEKGEVTDSQGSLKGATPLLPNGVLHDAKLQGEDRITWEPALGVRLAAVVVPYSNGNKAGYVLVARSLSEVEKHEAMLLKECVLAFITLAVGSFVLVFLLAKVLSKKQ